MEPKGTAVVTGASRGIGRATAIELARRGFDVVATMRDPRAGAGLEADGEGRLRVQRLDVNDPTSIALPSDLRVLVNNAGVEDDNLPLETMPSEIWRRLFETNVFGLVEVTKRAVPLMRAGGGGVICNVTSSSILAPVPFLGAYRASKAAVGAIGESLAGRGRRSSASAWSRSCRARSRPTCSRRRTGRPRRSTTRRTGPRREHVGDRARASATLHARERGGPPHRRRDPRRRRSAAIRMRRHERGHARGLAVGRVRRRMAPPDVRRLLARRPERRTDRNQEAATRPDGSFTGMATPPFRRQPRPARRRTAGRYDTETIHAILDGALVSHVGVVVGRTSDRDPHVARARRRRRCTCTVRWRAGSSGPSAGGVDVCVTATIVDGLVFARSAFHHSMNYRSVVVLGNAHAVDGDEKLHGLRTIAEHLTPGRWAEAREPNDVELRQTSVLRLPIDEASAKIRTGGPVDDEEDIDLPIWAGVLPLTPHWGASGRRRRSPSGDHPVGRGRRPPARGRREGYGRGVTYRVIQWATGGVGRGGDRGDPRSPRARAGRMLGPQRGEGRRRRR